jgi:hypothetical protein
VTPAEAADAVVVTEMASALLQRNFVDEEVDTAEWLWDRSGFPRFEDNLTDVVNDILDGDSTNGRHYFCECHVVAEGTERGETKSMIDGIEKFATAEAVNHERDVEGA